MKTKKNKDYAGVLSSVFAILIGLVVGLVVLILCNPSQALPGFLTILTGALTHGMRGVGQVFYYATPIILTGLSVGFAFKTGVFNIGTPGQFIMGAFGAVYAGIMWEQLGPVHWAAALLVSILMGALWGLVPGILKAYFNVNVVISCIMMNYIGMYLVNWIVRSYKPLFNTLRNESKNVAATAVIPKMGLDKVFPGSSVNGGILIAIAVVLFIYVLLNKTAFGYELKAVGYNGDAGKYAGINEKRNVVAAMMIAGAIAGLAGGLLYLAGTGKHIEIKDVLASEGFTGISVALLGLSHPIGVLFAGLFIAYLTAGGFYLQLFEFSTEIIDIIVAVIIYFSAFALIVKSFLGKIREHKAGGEGGSKA
ncbi:MAG: ABC transporter permease [Hungatella sp.]|nr:ABC transporter permease [Hungatella sp.]